MDLEQQVASAAGAVNTARIAAIEAADAEKVAAQLRSTKQLSLHRSFVAWLICVLNLVLCVNEAMPRHRHYYDSLGSSFKECRRLTKPLDGSRATNKAIGSTSRNEAHLVRARCSGTEERSKSIRIQSDAVERELVSTQCNLDQLVSAQIRFTKIADELQKTAESEAAGALRHQRQAIQQCFAAIYPHGHLNEIVMGDDPLGEVLVTDKLLARGFEPTTYLSTGQSNVSSSFGFSWHRAPPTTP